MDTQQLQDIEEIRQLKARYFRLMDLQQWEEWQHCFTEDVSAFYGRSIRRRPDLPSDIGCEGRAALVKGVSGLLGEGKSIHQGFMPEIQLTSTTTAKGIWSMFDWVWIPTCQYRGWGHYYEDYVKENGVWKIKKIKLTRVHVEEVWL